MIQTQVGGYRLEPSASGWAVLQLLETLVSFQKRLLGDVFGFGLINDQAHSGAEYHVLVILHERLELLRVCHRVAVTARGLS